MAKLTPKQQRFVDEYLVDLNATQACIRAGYSKDTAYSQGQRLLKNVEIQNAIQQAMNERQQRTRIDQDYVINTIVDTIERCRQAKEVLNKDGEPVYIENADGELVPAYRFDASNVLKGAELLGKHLGMFVDRKEITGKDGKDLYPSGLGHFYGDIESSSE